MSRIGKTPIQVEKNVTVTQKDGDVVVSGPKGTLTYTIPSGIHIKQEHGVISIETTHRDRTSRALHGFVRAHLANLMRGVTEEWKKTLELSGVGYRANLNGQNLVLTVGFSHPVTIVPPSGISFSTAEGKIIVSGIDKRLVGQVAADIRKVKKPEPYKGKGIKYQGEHIRKKAGKSVKGLAGAPAGK